MARLEPAADPAVVVTTIDGTFENSSDPTASMSEDDYSRQFARQIGDIGVIATSILAAVFFTIVLLTANVAAASFRERVAELAVMKTLGFTDVMAGLVLGESITRAVAGAVVDPRTTSHALRADTSQLATGRQSC